MVRGRLSLCAGLSTDAVTGKYDSNRKDRNRPVGYGTDQNQTDRQFVRLAKRMSELDMCSRREADALIQAGRVLVRGGGTVLGQKVSSDETDIDIVGSPDGVKAGGSHTEISAVVLHKPIGYVSGQPEPGHGHIPAVTLLTEQNLTDGNPDDFTFFQRSFYGWEKAEGSSGTRRHGQSHNHSGDGDRSGHERSSKGTARKENPDGPMEPTLKGLAPAGRLDLRSTGLLVFCSSGVLAKRLVSSFGLVEKEYIVTVEPAHQPTQKERDLGMVKLPQPTFDLTKIREGGYTLLGDDKIILPAKAHWVDIGRCLRLRLRQGRKHQIRRMCREILGHHVTELQRVRVGPIKLNDLPVGKWRPLTKREISIIMNTNNDNNNDNNNNNNRTVATKSKRRR